MSNGAAVVFEIIIFYLISKSFHIAMTPHFHSNAFIFSDILSFKYVLAYNYNSNIIIF